jgi:hypothetical protein
LMHMIRERYDLIKNWIRIWYDNDRNSDDNG